MLFRSHADALPLFVRALGIQEKELGPNHPFTATSLNNLAGLYKAMGRHADAQPLYDRAVAILDSSLGSKHPSTKTVASNLGVCARKFVRVFSLWS